MIQFATPVTKIFAKYGIDGFPLDGELPDIYFSDVRFGTCEIEGQCYLTLAEAPSPYNNFQCHFGKADYAGSAFDKELLPYSSFIFYPIEQHGI